MNILIGASECITVEMLEYFNLVKMILIKVFLVCCFMDCYCHIPYLFIVL